MLKGGAVSSRVSAHGRSAGGPVVLDVTGPAGSREFLLAILEPLPRTSKMVWTAGRAGGPLRPRQAPESFRSADLRMICGRRKFVGPLLGPPLRRHDVFDGE